MINFAIYLIKLQSIFYSQAKMSNTTEIMQLPDEVLTKILNFVPNRFDLAQVCKKFYDLTSEIEKFKFKLALGVRHDKVSSTV